jgi:hypothetical protein
MNLSKLTHKQLRDVDEMLIKGLQKLEQMDSRHQFKNHVSAQQSELLIRNLRIAVYAIRDFQKTDSCAEYFAGR